MEAQNLPSRRLVLISTLLVLLLVITLGAAFVIHLLSQKVSQEGGKTALINPTPTSEPIIYLDLPQSFPRDMLLPPRAKVTVGKESENDWTAVLLTTTPLEQISDFYIKELPKAGWLITNQSQGGGITLIYATKDRREAIIAIGKGDLGITVSITILKG